MFQVLIGILKTAYIHLIRSPIGHQFQVLIGILKTLLNVISQSLSLTVSSPYRYSKNVWGAYGCAFVGVVSSPYRYSKNLIRLP